MNTKEEAAKEYRQQFAANGSHLEKCSHMSFIAGVSWASEKIFNSDIEYIRKDLAEEIAKEFGAYVYLTKDDDERITDHVGYFNGLFTEFINSRKAEK